MNRRSFLKRSTTGSLAVMVSSGLGLRSLGVEKALSHDLRDLFEVEDPETFCLVEDVFREWYWRERDVTHAGLVAAMREHMIGVGRA